MRNILTPTEEVMRRHIEMLQDMIRETKLIAISRQEFIYKWHDYMPTINEHIAKILIIKSEMETKTAFWLKEIDTCIRHLTSVAVTTEVHHIYEKLSKDELWAEWHQRYLKFAVLSYIKKNSNNKANIREATWQDIRLTANKILRQIFSIAQEIDIRINKFKNGMVAENLKLNKLIKDFHNKHQETKTLTGIKLLPKIIEGLK